MFEDKTMEIFSSRDMIRQQLISYAENYLEINDIDLTKSSYLSYLINILSVLTSNLIYYNTATYREFFLVRAHQKESVLNLAAMLGYDPDNAVPATVQVLVSMPAEFRSSAQVIMNGRHDPNNEPFKFYADDIVFSCENKVQIDIIMDRGRLLSANITETNMETGGVRNLNWRLSPDRKFLHFMVNATQVIDQVTTFNFPPLKPYQYYTQTIPFSGDFAGIDLQTVGMRTEIKQYWDAELSRMTNDVVEILEDDAIHWESKASLFLITPGEYGYTYRVNENSVKVFFGNGVIGTQPTENHQCTITTQVTKGFDGNVLAGAINRADRLTTRVEFNGAITELPVDLKCINVSAAVGGKGYPTIDEVRTQAIVQVSTNKRLVTEYDFDNASGVVRDLPIQHSLPILKRSDLKRNEICLFTDVIFGNEYVPTRNAVIKILAGDENFPIRYRDPITFDLNRFEREEDYENTEFVSMFDIQIDPIQRTCSYFYTLDTIEKESVLKRTWTNETVVFPNNVRFTVNRDSTSSEDDTLTVDFFFEKISTKTLYDNVVCYLEIAESGDYLPTTLVDSTSGTYFTISRDLLDIDEGELLFDFQMKYVDPVSGEEEWLCNSQVQTVIKQSLDSFMYSKVKKYSSTDPDSQGGLYWGILYDVPVVLADYLVQLEENEQKDNFTEQVLHRIVTFDMSQYKMLTDFVNLKFSNTYGVITNMNHNPETKGIINRIDPETMPSCPGNGFTCAVTNNTNVWNGSPWFKEEGGFLARYYPNEPGEWIFSDLKTNDILLYDYIAPGEQYRAPIPPDNSSKHRGMTARDALPRLIYNGDNLFSMSKPIPLEINLEVWKKPGVSLSDSGLVQLIKNTITTSYAEKMGYDKPVYISDITKLVQTLNGVDYCKVTKPDHDIFFNYDFNTFKHEDLLRYSPQLVYISSNSINVTLRKRNDLRS